MFLFYIIYREIIEVNKHKKKLQIYMIIRKELHNINTLGNVIIMTMTMTMTMTLTIK